MIYSTDKDKFSLPYITHARILFKTHTAPHHDENRHYPGNLSRNSATISAGKAAY